MEYINYYVANTSYKCKVYPDEIDKDNYLIIAQIVKRAIKGEKPKILNGYLTLITQLDCYAAILWIDDFTPILLSIGANCEEGRRNLNKIIVNEISPYPVPTPILPSAPVVADYIFVPDKTLVPKVQKKIGNFTRQLAWTLMAPEQIR